MSYLTVDEMRCAIKKVYYSPAWFRKVAAMYDNQVIAIYYRFLADGKFDKKPVEKSNPPSDEQIKTWCDPTYTEVEVKQPSFF